MFFVTDGYSYCRNRARNVSPHLFATFLSVRIPDCSFQYLEGFITQKPSSYYSSYPAILQAPQPVPLKPKEKRAPKRSPPQSTQHEKSPKSFHMFTVSSLENHRLLQEHKSCNFFMNRAPWHRTSQSMMKKNFRLHCTLATSSSGRSTCHVQAKKGTARAIIWGCSNIFAETARKRRDGDGEFLLAKLTWAHVWPAQYA